MLLSIRLNAGANFSEAHRKPAPKTNPKMPPTPAQMTGAANAAKGMTNSHAKNLAKPGEIALAELISAGRRDLKKDIQTSIGCRIRISARWYVHSLSERAWAIPTPLFKVSSLFGRSIGSFPS